jgi:aconitate hydratase
VGLDESLQPQSELVLRVTKDGESNDIPVLCRIDTPIEVDYYRHGGILPYVLRQLAG